MNAQTADNPRPIKEPLFLDEMTPDEIVAAVLEGIESGKSGKSYSLQEVRTKFERSHKL